MGFLDLCTRAGAFLLYKALWIPEKLLHDIIPAVWLHLHTIIVSHRYGEMALQILRRIFGF